MIKIQRIAAPAELTPNVVALKTAQFIADSSKHVWKETYIADRLMLMTHGKCCYCEMKLNEEAKYMEIEHFHDKNHYPNEVVDWNNLLPSCRSCNAAKSDHDTVSDPIIDPTKDNPRTHLAFKDFRYRGKTDMGKETISLLNLNDTESRCVVRFKICEDLNKKAEQLKDAVKDISSLSSTRSKNTLKNNVLELMELCQSNQAYTAVKVTTMLNDPDYKELVSQMKAKDLWTDEHERLYEQMKLYELDRI